MSARKDERAGENGAKDQRRKSANGTKSKKGKSGGDSQQGDAAPAPPQALWKSPKAKWVACAITLLTLLFAIISVNMSRRTDLDDKLVRQKTQFLLFKEELRKEQAETVAQLRSQQKEQFEKLEVKLQANLEEFLQTTSA